MEWRIVDQQPGALIAHVDGLLVQIWEGPAPRAAAYDAIPPVLDDDARRNGVRPACLVVVAPSSELPDAEARQRGATLPRHISFYVGVHEGSGFRASLLRMVIASIAMISRDSLRHEIVGDVETGCATLWPSLSPTLQQRWPDAAALAAAIAELRARIEPYRKTPRTG